MLRGTSVEKTRQQLAPRPRNKLARFAAGGHVDGFLCVIGGGLPHQVGVERASEPSVGANDEDQLLGGRSNLQERMKQRIGAALERHEHAVHQLRVRPARECMLLRLAHFRGSNHLHRFRDLRGVANRLDPASDVLRVRHVVRRLLPGRLEIV